MPPCRSIHSISLTDTVCLLKCTRRVDGTDHETAECIYNRRWNQRPVSGIVKSAQRQSGASAIGNGDLPGVSGKTLSNEDDAKLIFGSIFSLRRMVRQLGGEDDRCALCFRFPVYCTHNLSFLSYRTGEYKLHYFETPTNLKFVMLTDTRIGNMRTVLYQIWANLYVEYVVKNPISPVEHPGGIGVANELFDGGLESFIVCCRIVHYAPGYSMDA